MPGGREVRVREVQVHGRAVQRAEPGRTALDLAGVEASELRRGLVLSADPDVGAADRILVALRGSGPRHEVPAPGTRLRLHMGTEQVEAVVARAARDAVLPGDERAAMLRLERSVAAAPGDRFVLRDPGARATAAGGRVLDVEPPRAAARRRMTPERLGALAVAADRGSREQARLGLHGVLGGGIAPDLAQELVALAIGAVGDHHAADPDSAGMPLPELRARVARAVRRSAGLTPEAADKVAGALNERLVGEGRLERDGDRLRLPGRAAGPPPALAAAMDRLEAALAVVAPPPFDEAVRDLGCPPEGVRALEASGRITRLDSDLAYAAGTLRALEDARAGPRGCGPPDARRRSGTRPGRAAAMSWRSSRTSIAAASCSARRRATFRGRGRRRGGRGDAGERSERSERDRPRGWRLIAFRAGQAHGGRRRRTDAPSRDRRRG